MVWKSFLIRTISQNTPALPQIDWRDSRAGTSIDVLDLLYEYFLVGWKYVSDHF